MAHKVPSVVVVHPLVLLSVVDHYNRVARDTPKRVVGVLLGSRDKDGTVDVTNSYAVPFEESRSGVWFVDHDFHETMFAMFKKVNASENVVGWYSTGPKIKPADLEINELWRKYTPNPAFVIINVHPNELELPTKAYVSVEEVSEDGTQSKRVFRHIPSEIGAVEAEEVGVEHLLRDIKDTSISNVATDVNAKLLSLKNLVSRIKDMHEYLVSVCEGKLPVNQQIIGHFQDVFNLLPNINVPELIRSFAVKTNDMMLVIYLSSLIRSVIAIHNLIDNTLENSKTLEEGGAADDEAGVVSVEEGSSGEGKVKPDDEG